MVDCDRQEVADVLGDLRDILDDEQANLVAGAGGHRGRLYQARSALRPPDSDSAPGRSLLADEDRSVVAGADRRQIVVAGEDLDDQTGVLGEDAELVRADQPQAVLAHPALRRLALAVPRRRSSVSATVPVAASW